MNIIKSILALGIITASLTLSGCFTPRDPAESNLPWARPAAWENKGPAMKF